jgi:hypothetical protein
MTQHDWEPGDTPKGAAFDPTDTTPVTCNNYDWEGLANELGCQLPDVPDLFDRIAPGETVPTGECPACGCLASVKDFFAVHISKIMSP